MGIAVPLIFLVALSAVDVERLERYNGAWAMADGAPALVQQARAEFAGRGPDIANHFLLHTDPKPRNDTYFFVLRAVGDADTALTLIRALSNPPRRESGVLDRHFGEVSSAIEAVLTAEAARLDPRIPAGLEMAVATARSKPYGSGMPEALEAVRLIGLLRANEAAARLLQRLAADADAAIRTAAAQALGQLGLSAAVTTTPAPASPGAELLRLLTSDPAAQTRVQAAESLGALEGPEVVPGLEAALGAERDSHVVDAIVQSLRRRGARVHDPARCRELLDRTWEASVAQDVLDCWRQGGATIDQLVQVAQTGSPTARGAAVSALTTRPDTEARVLAAAGSTEPAHIDPSLRDQLLDAAVWVLSQGDRISASMRGATEQALWNAAGRSMPLALPHADRIVPTASRMHASGFLARADPSGYDAARRSRQIGLALLIVCLAGLMAIPRSPLRPSVLLFGASAVVWAVWTLQATGVRDLPPPPLQALAVSAIACLSAGMAVAAAQLVHRGSAPGRASTIIRIVLTLLAAGAIAGTVCGVTRNSRVFPVEGDGLQMIFDPLAASILAVVIAAGLLAADRVLATLRRAP